MEAAGSSPSPDLLELARVALQLLSLVFPKPRLTQALVGWPIFVDLDVGSPLSDRRAITARIAGISRSKAHHSVTGNGERDGLKSASMGQSAAEPV